MTRRYPRNRAGRDRPGKQRAALAPPAERRVDAHPLYGDIPLIRVAVTGVDGKTHAWWQHDPDYRPPLPRGALRGNVHKQRFCTAHHVPRYFYLDEPRRCVQCGADFTFEAAEQKHWYETLGFNFGSIPIRCASCRRRRRTEHALRAQIAEAKASLRSHGRDPDAQLSLARALIDYHERTGHGDLDEAVAAARKASARYPESAEPLFWEGVAHIRAGRAQRGRELLRAFLAQRDRAPASLVKRAQDYLA